MSCPNQGILGQNITLTLQCETAGAPVDADEPPTYKIYEDTTGTAILSGSMAKLDDEGTTGFYAVTIEVSADNGFELWKTYTIRYISIIDAISAVKLDSFNVISTAVAFSSVTGAYAVSETQICNMALAKLGAKRINDITYDVTPEAVQCQTHYVQTRNALLRSFEWTFAIERVKLSESTEAPGFEWDHQYLLPNDFIRLKKVYELSDLDSVADRFILEGQKLLTNLDSVSIVYIKRVIDPAEFDPLFTELLVLSLALKMLYPLAGTNTFELKKDLFREFAETNSRARAICGQETNVTGRSDWRLARLK